MYGLIAWKFQLQRLAKSGSAQRSSSNFHIVHGMTKYTSFMRVWVFPDFRTMMCIRHFQLLPLPQFLKIGLRSGPFIRIMLRCIIWIRATMAMRWKQPEIFWIFIKIRKSSSRRSFRKYLLWHRSCWVIGTCMCIRVVKVIMSGCRCMIWISRRFCSIVWLECISQKLLR